VAHRGHTRRHAENSLPAFRAVVESGADAAELDVHLTRDGELAVIHDPTLDRTTGGRGPVGERRWAELQAYRLGDGEAGAIPRLADVLAVLAPAGLGVLIEVKTAADGRAYPDIERRLLAAIEAAGMADRATITAFAWDSLVRMASLTSRLRLAGIIDRRAADAGGGLARAAERLLGMVRATDLGVEHTLLSDDAAAVVHGAGLALGVWTPSAPAALRRALASGADWIITDEPELAVELRAAA
jgi:glycerophosphoryl diester phosphodiesterase